MARRAFFSFHFERDAWRAAQIRNSWVTKDREGAGFWDAADWEAVKRKGDAAVEAWIDNQLHGTSVSVVLIGAETAQREYVGYEIKTSHVRGSGMLGIYIDKLKDQFQTTDRRGPNPFDNWSIQQSGRKILFSQIYPTYDWVSDNGYQNMGAWIEAAALRAGKLP